MLSIEVNKGKITFIDSQSGKSSTDGKFSRSIDGRAFTINVFKSKNTKIFRTDNLELSPNILNSVGGEKGQ